MASQSMALGQLLNQLTVEGTLYEKLPDNAVRCYACAHRCLIREGRHAEATPLLRVSDVVVSESDGYAELARLYRQLDRRRDAEEAFRRHLDAAGRGAPGTERGTVEFTADWSTHTTSNDRFGYDTNYMIYCAFVDYADPGAIDPHYNAKVESFSAVLVNRLKAELLE